MVAFANSLLARTPWARQELLWPVHTKLVEDICSRNRQDRWCFSLRFSLSLLCHEPVVPGAFEFRAYSRRVVLRPRLGVAFSRVCVVVNDRRGGWIRA
jgi:hypothetical protein